MLCLGQVAQADQPEDVRLDLGLGDLLPRRGVSAGASLSGQRRKLGDRAFEAGRLGQPSTLETEDSHRDLPTISGLADQVAVIDLGSG